MALILVTGGAGFIGSHMTQALVARGDRVRILDDFSSGTMDNLSALETGAVRSGAPVEILRATRGSTSILSSSQNDKLNLCIGTKTK